MPERRRSEDGRTPKTPIVRRVKDALDWLERRGSRKTRDQMLPRYGIAVRKAFGVPVGTIHVLAKEIGKDHELALALWKTGCYEARLLAAFIDEPARVTAAQMDAWAADFESWADCDTVCFHLFDRTPLAWKKIAPWCRRRDEFVRRAGFALLASLALHDKSAGDGAFLRSLPLVERGAADERNFVKKGVSWALRGIGRRNLALHAAAVAAARRLAESPAAAARWVGKDALRDLTRAAVVSRLRARRERDLNGSGVRPGAARGRRRVSDAGGRAASQSS